MFYEFFIANYHVDMCAAHFMVEFSTNICCEFSSIYKTCTLFSPQTLCLKSYYTIYFKKSSLPLFMVVTISVMFVICSDMSKCTWPVHIKVAGTVRQRVEELKYLGTALMIQNSFQDDIKSRLKAGNACYHHTQNFFVFQFAIEKYVD